MHTEVKQRKAVVRKKREKPTQTARPDEVKFSLSLCPPHLVAISVTSVI